MEVSVEILVHYWLNNPLKYLPLVLKLVINSLLISNEIITGTFLPLTNFFDQHVSALVIGLTNFAGNLLILSFSITDQLLKLDL